MKGVTCFLKKMNMKGCNACSNVGLQKLAKCWKHKEDVIQC